MGRRLLFIAAAAACGACSSPDDRPAVVSSGESCPACAGASGHTEGAEAEEGGGEPEAAGGADGSGPTEGGGEAGWVADLICDDAERPDPSRWQADMDAFQQRDATSPPPSDLLVFTGSSSIARWDSLQSDWAPRDVVKNGFGGSWISDQLAWWETTIAPYSASGVVLYAGENDLNGGLSPQCTFLDFVELVDLLRLEGVEAPLFYVSAKPSPSRVHLLEELATLNGYVDRYAGETQGVVYVDVYAPMLNDQGEPRSELFVSDNLHLNAAGYALWTETLEPAVGEALD